MINDLMIKVKHIVLDCSELWY